VSGLFDAGRNLWLAGLGGVAGAGDGGRELFDRLVERGRPVEERGKKVVTEVAGRTSRALRELGKLLRDQAAWESRGLLKKLNLTTVEDVKILAARLETLSRKLDEYAVLKAAQRASVAPAGTKTEIILTDAPEAVGSR
jgi:polyhydroxyalkanoate synthesis regulator phasin